MSDGEKPSLYISVFRSQRSGHEGIDMSDACGKPALYNWIVFMPGKSGHGRHT